MSTARLTQRRVLSVLGDWRDDAPPTPSDLAPWVFSSLRDPHFSRPTSEAEAVAGALNRLAKKGYAERLGTAQTGARCWRITEAGKSHLKAEAPGA